MASRALSFTDEDLCFVFHDVVGKPYNSDRIACRKLNRLIDNEIYHEVDLYIKRLKATQAKINEDYHKAVDRYDPKCPLRLPAVVKYQDLYYISDGHHRLVSLSKQGAITAKVRLYDLDGTTQIEMPILDFLEA